MIKLNIQRFASTNKTTHYELSQYIGTDKPTYLTDYNQDMSRIDAGIYGAKSLADVNETAIGDLTNLTTTAKTNLVSAINELDGEVATNTGNISTNTTNIDANTTAIGTLSNLTTSAKNNLVSAINEVDANCDSNTSTIATNTSAIGDLSDLETVIKTNLVSSINEIVEKFNLTTFKTFTNSDMIFDSCSYKSGDLTLASNKDYSVIKLYGALRLDTISTSWGCSAKINNVIPVGYRPTQAITVNPAGVLLSGSESARVNITFNTDGSVDIAMPKGTNQNVTISAIFIPFMIFLKDFGDVPSPTP